MFEDNDNNDTMRIISNNKLKTINPRRNWLKMVSIIDNNIPNELVT